MRQNRFDNSTVLWQNETILKLGALKFFILFFSDSRLKVSNSIDSNNYCEPKPLYAKSNVVFRRFFNVVILCTDTTMAVYIICTTRRATSKTYDKLHVSTLKCKIEVVYYNAHSNIHERNEKSHDLYVSRCGRE